MIRHIRVQKLLENAVGAYLYEDAMRKHFRPGEQFNSIFERDAVLLLSRIMRFAPRDVQGEVLTYLHAMAAIGDFANWAVEGAVHGHT
jgi:hypothetical protein